VDNATKANIYGAEAEMRYAVNNHFNIHSSLGVIEAKFKEYVSNNTDYSGNKLIKVPEYTFVLGSEYDFYQNYYINGMLKSNGKTYFDKANSVSKSHYETVDAKIGFRSKNLSWYIYANNIFDKRYLNFVVSAQGLKAYNFGEPRRIGASMTYSF
jgi:iron complex outermembrane receptor protein